MSISKDMRQRIDTLVAIYLNDLESLSKDAGWHQPSTIDLLIQFGGDIPSSSGNDQADLKMIHEIRFLRKEHALLGQARYLFGKPCGTGEVPRELTLALLANRFYKNTAKDIVAKTLCLTADQFKWRLKNGYEKSSVELLKVDRYRECIASKAS